MSYLPQPFRMLTITGPTASDWKIETPSLIIADPPSDETIQDLASANHLAFFNKFVGGTIDMVRLCDEGIFVVVNDDGKLINLPPHAAWVYRGKVHDILVGNVAFVRSDPYGNSVPLREGDEDVIRRHIRPVKQ